MKSVTIKGELRSSLGKKESKKLRSAEKVPAVLYGGEAPLHFSVDFAELRKIIYTPSVHLIDLEIDGNVYKSIVQDIQWHPVEEMVLHIDFLQISENKPIKINIPIKVYGHAEGTKAGGKLSTNMRRLKVKALASDLPDFIDIDVTKLGLGQSIKVADLNVNNVEFLDPKTNVVVSVTVTRAAMSAGGTNTEEAATEGGAEEAPASEE